MQLERAKDDDLLIDSARSSTPPVADAFEATPPARFPHSRFRIVTCNADHPRRAEAESFVGERFNRTHGAKVRTFMPNLLLLTDTSDSLWGVTGARPASSEPLFLERYFDRPIESVLEAGTGSRIRRSEVVEIGNFACRSPRAATTFVSLLPRHLLHLGYVWVTFTATTSIRRILRHLGARCADLGPADGACVRGGADEWGRYYTNEPRVMAGYLPLARRIRGLWASPYAD